MTSLICTIGRRLLGHTVKHWTTYERFFYRAAWSLDRLSSLVLTRVIMPLIEKEAAGGPGKRSAGCIELIFDGTTAGRTGKHVAYAGYFKGASAGNTVKAAVNWAHHWLIGCVVLRPRRWPHWAVALPVWFALYRKRADCGKHCPCATTRELAGRMIQDTRRILPDRVIHSCGDGQFATRQVVEALDERSNLVARIRCDAALYEVPKCPRRRTRGSTTQEGSSATAAKDPGYTSQERLADNLGAQGWHHRQATCPLIGVSVVSRVQ